MDIPQISSLESLFKEKEESIIEEIDFNPLHHKIIPSSSIHEEEFMREMYSQFRDKGWIVLDLSSESDFQSVHPKREEDALLSFFEDLDDEEKEMYSHYDGYGYNKVDHKQSIHLVTYDYVMRKKIGSETIHSSLLFLRRFNRAMDAFTSKFVKSLAEMLEYEDESFLSEKADLHLVSGNHTVLLDVAYYHNTKASDESKVFRIGRDTEQVNCVPHYDPGLFSLSFLSNNEGLQLYDPQKKTWFGGPLSIEGQMKFAVLWLGQACVKASDGKFQAGVHRVVYPRPQNQKPRLTAWYEVCTNQQINGAIDSGIPVSEDSNLTIKSILNTVNVFMGKGTNQQQVLKAVEKQYGVIGSKVESGEIRVPIRRHKSSYLN
eukprot:TRINITY_DN4614_c0_g2_i3.p1 TRINITY_DN4614_c0_g2~~TRINITY_DN4614_c0_g2_i3.p1  ORF type:complete len:392 (-),score=81.27 TRINITY_DN4614_c0_g2_i3:132-1256(-)